MAARFRACDADPRWPKRLLLHLWNAPTSPTPRQAKPPQNRLYWRLGVNFDMRKSISSSTP